MTVPDVAAFIRARLDEAEAVATRACEGPWRYNPRKQWHSPPAVFGVPAPPEEFVAAGPLADPLCIAVTGPADNLESMADAAHIALNDPVHVLAWVAAVRRVLALTECHACQIEQQPCDHRDDTHRALAAAWREHPDYRTEWEA